MYSRAITYLLLSAAITNPMYAQSVIPSEKNNLKNKKAPVKVKNLDELSNDVNETSKVYIDTRNLSDMLFFTHPQTVKSEERGLQSLVSSFRSNIRFGGFWDKYAVINFSPSVFVKPFDFISIYGNHNSGYFIPIKAIKQEMKSLCIRSAAILAIDNACRYLLGTTGLVPSVT